MQAMLFQLVESFTKIKAPEHSSSLIGTSFHKEFVQEDKEWR